MDLTLRFWGSQGRVGVVGSGEWKGRYIFVYPDTLPEWWTIVIEPSPFEDNPGDIYLEGNASVMKLLEDCEITWLVAGSPSEARIEQEQFGWRPLGTPVEWLD